VAGPTEADIARSELRWAWAVGAVVAVIFAAIVYAGVAMHRAPPGSVETIDPATLQLGEFAEPNLGTQVGADGRVTVRIVATQFAFVPRCVVAPAGRLVTLRVSSPDVIHGLLVVGTNVNTMVVPGYVSEVRTVFARPGDRLMPCHEFCGLGHSQMMGVVRVVKPQDFRPDAKGRVSCADR
jgi:cytochrome c oxidase subunit 2